MKQIIFLLGIIALLFLCGCTDQGDGGIAPINKTLSCTKPYILSEGSCCLDIDVNGVCDATEQTRQETTSIVTTTEPQITTTTIPQSTCIDGVQNGVETGVDCGGPCKPCQTLCEIFINTTAVKPAARTSMLCLNTREQTSYEGLNFSVTNSDSGMMITASDANGSPKHAMLLENTDMSIENIAFRFIGRAKKNSTTYVWLYAWVSEEGIVCRVNSDCGGMDISAYTCIDNKAIIKQYYTYKCIEPGTIFSECRKQQNQEPFKICDESKRCVSGDDLCFPKECFDGISTKDEDDVDCGGSCRPCHCFNGVRDDAEKGIDCEGGCKPCLGNYGRDTIPPVITMSSPVNAVYTNQRVELNYLTDEAVSKCGYSVNGKPNVTIMRNGTVYADRGENDLVLYCRDIAGNVGTVRQQFTVFVKENRVCPKDNVAEAYSDYFDSIFFYTDTERELGVPEKCSQSIFNYALTYVNDSDLHYQSYEGTNDTSNGNLTPTNGFLGYDCRAAGDLEAKYAVLTKSAGKKAYSKAKTVVYFTQNTQTDMKNSFWRVYAYDSGTDMPDTGKYVDIPYRPIKSLCGSDETVSYYQELDFSGLMEEPMETIHLRMALFSAGVNSVVAINEVELLLEPATGKIN
jgi:hypothetical protein